MGRRAKKAPVRNSNVIISRSCHFMFIIGAFD